MPKKLRFLCFYLGIELGAIPKIFIKFKEKS